MREKVYLETTIISYLTGKPSRNLLAAAWQSLTLEWWEKRRHSFDLFVSEIVLEEAAMGDEIAAKRRLEAIGDIPLLEVVDEAIELAKELITLGPLPAKAANDALHLALASYHQIDYLLTWNCRHLDNAELKPKIRQVLFAKGYKMPEICTPQELAGEDENESEE